MVGDWLLGLLTLATSYPEYLLSAASFALLSLLAYCHRARGSSGSIIADWPVFHHLPDYLANVHRVHDYVTDCLRLAGCSFQFRAPWLLGMDRFMTCDPANVNHVFNLNFANYPKGNDYSELFDILGHGIFNADGESWRCQRKKAHSLMSHPRFRSFVARRSRAKVEDGLIPLMSQLADQQVVVDLQDVFLRLTFDLTCELVCGVDPSCLSPGLPTIPIAKAMDDAMAALFFRHVVPPPCWKLLRWLRVGTERDLDVAWKVFDEYVAGIIAKKREETKQQPQQREGDHEEEAMDMLSSYMEEPTDEGKDCSMVFDDKFLRDTTVNLMLAGRDTTGSTLTWFFWLLSKNPDVEKKLIEELTNHLLRNKKELCLHAPIVFDAEEVGKLVYLHAALCECLRLYPPVAFEHKGVVKPEVLPSGDEVRPGRKVLFATYSMARMEGVWGKDCMEFKPERWISEQGKVRHEPAYKFFSFNCGPRTCLGKDIAFTQLKVVVAAMVCNYHVEVLKGHVAGPKLSIILLMKDGLQVRIRKRRQLLGMVNGVSSIEVITC